MSLTPQELASLLAAGRPLLLLDVRRAQAFAADRRLLPGALRRDPDAVASWIAGLAAGLPVVVYCVHGHEVSRGVRDRLRAAGLDARLLAGGFEGWLAAGGACTATVDGVS